MARTTVRVRAQVQDQRGYVDKLLQAFAELRRLEIQIGIFGDQDSHLLMVAWVNEYGCNIEVTPKMRAWFRHQGYPLKATTTQIVIPERSFLRTSFMDNLDELNRISQTLFNHLVALRLTPREFCERIGAWMASKAVEWLDKVEEPPLHPMTVERKGSSKPLVDEGRMRQSITYRVVTAGDDAIRL